MPIFVDIPNQFYQCNDGTFSDHNRRGACVHHGGVASNDPINQKTGKAADVQMVNVGYINVAHEWFQNRANPYSLRSVQNIVDAVSNGEFKWANMDAVTLWRSPQGKIFMLSGHSRLEAFTQLCQGGYKVDGKDFCEIPAKFFSGTLEEAKKVATESNTLSTKETDLERAAFYRGQREAGADIKKLNELAKKLEGRNANTIMAYSYLSESGKTWAALYALQEGDRDSKNVIVSVGRWIGNARRTYDQLSNHHENELYDWLVNQQGYGTAKHQVGSESKFKERLYSIINRRTEFGVLNESLNISQNLQLSPVERQYNEQIETAKKEVTEAQKALKSKIRELAGRGASKSDIARIVSPLETAVTRAQLNYQNLLAKRDQVREAAGREMSLFSVNGIRRRKFLAI